MHGLSRWHGVPGPCVLAPRLLVRLILHWQRNILYALPSRLLLPQQQHCAYWLRGWLVLPSWRHLVHKLPSWLVVCGHRISSSSLPAWHLQRWRCICVLTLPSRLILC